MIWFLAPPLLYLGKKIYDAYEEDQRQELENDRKREREKENKKEREKEIKAATELQRKNLSTQICNYTCEALQDINRKYCGSGRGAYYGSLNLATIKSMSNNRLSSRPYRKLLEAFKNDSWYIINYNQINDLEEENKTLIRLSNEIESALDMGEKTDS